MKVLCGPIKLPWALNTLSAVHSGGGSLLLCLSSHQRKYEAESSPCLQIFTLDPVTSPPYRHQNENDASSLQPVPPPAYLPASGGSLLALITVSPLVHPNQRYYHPPPTKTLRPEIWAIFGSFLPPLPLHQTISASCLLCFRHLLQVPTLLSSAAQPSPGKLPEFPTGLPAATLNPLSPFSPEKPRDILGRNKSDL